MKGSKAEVKIDFKILLFIGKQPLSCIIIAEKNKNFNNKCLQSKKYVVHYCKQSRYVSVKCREDGELPHGRKDFLRFTFRIPLENNNDDESLFIIQRNNKEAYYV